MSSFNSFWMNEYLYYQSSLQKEMLTICEDMTPGQLNENRNTVNQQYPLGTRFFVFYWNDILKLLRPKCYHDHK